MWISYSDSEVNDFHPICEKALTNALKKLNKINEYRVLHHQYTGSLEMDFCVQSTITGKYLCVIEVKRTPADVHSSRYQFQAMSYVQMNSGNNEQPFYILTNLEYAFSFRYDAQRPKVFQQILKPGLTKIALFKDTEKDAFIDRLTDYFVQTIDGFLNNRYDYLVTLEEFANHIQKIQADPKKWKSNLAALLYEYIRGAFTNIDRSDFKDIRVFREDVKRICDEAIRVNFKDIFNYSDELFERRVSISNDILTNLFDFGCQNVTGDSVSDILHQIVSSGHEHDGEVPTDLELGRIVATMARYLSGDLNNNELICDPAAGSGNLLSSAINVFNVGANQIIANDINPKLIELLSLRLGLNYAKTVASDNSPTITNYNISDLKESFFQNVRVVIMNPPFIAGINCVDKKGPLLNRIKQITGVNPITDVGQMPMEAVFVELLTSIVAPGTIIASVFPKTHLTARGIEAKRIRKMLLNQFGLRVVFCYPGNGIFNGVTMDTCVLVGCASSPANNIEVISSYEEIPDIDNHRLEESLKITFQDQFQSIMPGIVARSLSKKALENCVESGWRELNSEMVEAIAFVHDNIITSEYMMKLDEKDIPIKRGTAGNSGGSDLVFFDSRPDFFELFSNSKVVLKPALRNAKMDSFLIEEGDAKFLDITENDKELINDIVSAYIEMPKRSGKQKRQEKTKGQWFKILEKESRGRFLNNAVLIPRNIRRKGKVYLSAKPIFVSTNFVVCNLNTFEEAIVLATWVATIFYQLLCEVSSKDQEGARKMEVNDILSTYIPKPDCVTSLTIKRLKDASNNIEFLDLQEPLVREIDVIWAEELFGEDARDILEEARRLLEFLANRRNQ